MKTFYPRDRQRRIDSDDSPNRAVIENTIETTAQKEIAPHQQVAVTARHRRSRYFLIRMAALFLMICLWPASLLFPTCINWWPGLDVQVTINHFEGVGSVLGLADGRLFLLRGKVIPNPGKQWNGPNSYHVDLGDWWGSAFVGVGTRRRGFDSNPKWFEQSGVIVPLWPLSALPALWLAAKLIRKNRKYRTP